MTKPEAIPIIKKLSMEVNTLLCSLASVRNETNHRINGNLNNGK